MSLIRASKISLLSQINLYQRLNRCFGNIFDVTVGKQIVCRLRGVAICIDLAKSHLEYLSQSNVHRRIKHGTVDVVCSVRFTSLGIGLKKNDQPRRIFEAMHISLISFDRIICDEVIDCVARGLMLAGQPFPAAGVFRADPNHIDLLEKRTEAHDPGLVSIAMLSPGKFASIAFRIAVDSQANLPHVALAIQIARTGARRLDRRQQECHQQTDHGNYHQKLNQSETDFPIHVFIPTGIPLETTKPQRKSAGVRWQQIRQGLLPAPQIRAGERQSIFLPPHAVHNVTLLQNAHPAEAVGGD